MNIFPKNTCILCNTRLVRNGTMIYCPQNTKYELLKSHYRLTLIQNEIYVVTVKFDAYTLFHYLDQNQTAIWKNDCPVCIIPITNMNYSKIENLIKKLNILVLLS